MTIPASLAQPLPSAESARVKQSWWAGPLAPVAVFIVLSLTDALLSALLLRHGLMREANPLMRLALDNLGLLGFVGVKLAVTAVAASLLAAYHRALPRLAWTANALYALVWTCGFLLTNLGQLASLSAL